MQGILTLLHCIFHIRYANQLELITLVNGNGTDQYLDSIYVPLQ